MLSTPVLACVLLWSLAAYGIRRAPAREVRRVLQVGTRAMVMLALGSLGVLLTDPTDVPSVLRASYPFD
ncbi:hypothetical protein ACWC9F_27730 [Streptomyces sp. NPDC001110]